VAGWACSIASRRMELRVFGKSRPATYKNDRRPQLTLRFSHAIDVLPAELFL